ncbi:MAG: hypothetical protein Q8Q28_11110 [Pseudomonadota bacterium]|nr:hypothetical protein [Pseudomonadota bacterium]
MKENFRYRILIVEDDDGWYPYMKDALAEKLGECDVVSVQDAISGRKALRHSRFHGVSFDLEIPNSQSTGASASRIGADLYLETFHPLSSKAIFSAYLQTDAGEEARDQAVRRHTASLAKAISGRSDFANYTPRLSAQDWGDFMAARLTGMKPDFCKEEPASEHWLCRDWGRDPRATPYLALYWREAGKFLPPPLSLFARDLAASLGSLDSKGAPLSLDLQALHNLNQFREWTQHLAWTQSVVLMRRAGVSIDTCLFEAQQRGAPRSPTDPLYKKARDLQAWRQGSALRQAASWGAHLHWDEDGRLDFLAASDQVRKWRNDAVHGRPKPDYAGDWSSIRAAVLTLMDAAAFWSNAWLYAEPRTELGRWQGARLSGTATPWTRHDLGNLNQHPAGQRDSVFQKVWMKDGDKLGAVILDWSPWLFMAVDDETGQSVPWLLTHPVEGSGPLPRLWYAVCLTNPARVMKREVKWEALFGR